MGVWSWRSREPGWGQEHVGMKLQAKQNQNRNSSLLNYKWSWQGQAAGIFNKIPEELKKRPCNIMYFLFSNHYIYWFDLKRLN